MIFVPLLDRAGLRVEHGLRVHALEPQRAVPREQLRQLGGLVHGRQGGEVERAVQDLGLVQPKVETLVKPAQLATERFL